MGTEWLQVPTGNSPTLYTTLQLGDYEDWKCLKLPDSPDCLDNKNPDSKHVGTLREE